jgi:hypothetical protein
LNTEKCLKTTVLNDDGEELVFDTSVANLRRLTNTHINRYTNMIRMAENGSTNIRVGECAMYLNLWESVKHVEYDYNKCSQAAQNEIIDALASGE